MDLFQLKSSNKKNHNSINHYFNISHRKLLLSMTVIFTVTQLFYIAMTVKMTTDENIRLYALDNLRYLDGLAEALGMEENGLFHAKDDFDQVLGNLKNDFDIIDANFVDSVPKESFFSYTIGDALIVWNVSHVQTYLQVKSKKYETKNKYYVCITAPIKSPAWSFLLLFLSLALVGYISIRLSGTHSKGLHEKILVPISKLSGSLQSDTKIENSFDYYELEELRKAIYSYASNKIYIEAGKFMSGLHHCLSGALYDLDGFVKKIDSFEDIHQFNAYKEQVESSLESAKMIVGSLRDISSKPVEYLEESSFKRALANAFEHAQRSSRVKKDIKIIYKVGAMNLLKVPQATLYRILMNLIKNAIQEDISYIKVIPCESKNPQKCSILIVNDGHNEIIGESELFREYFTRKKGGTGLGLPIVKQMANKFNIDLEIFEGSGEFNVRLDLPISDSKDTSSPFIPKNTLEFSGHKDIYDEKLHQFTEKAKLLGKSYRVLVVDDRIGPFMSIQRMLKVTGLDKFISIEYADKFSGNRYDLYLVDLEFDGVLKGFEICKEIKEKFPSSNVCIHSNYLDKEFNQKALASQADYSLPKPLSLNQIIHLLERV